MRRQGTGAVREAAAGSVIALEVVGGAATGSVTVTAATAQEVGTGASCGLLKAEADRTANRRSVLRQ